MNSIPPKEAGPRRAAKFFFAAAGGIALLILLAWLAGLFYGALILALLLGVGLLLRQQKLMVTRRELIELKRAEEQVRKLSRAVEQSPASIVITNLRGDIEYVNPKFTDVTGYTLAEAVGKNPRILKSGELPPEAYHDLWKTITAGREWRGEFHNKKKNGGLYWEFASISPISDEAGRVTHFLAVKEDITERKRAEILLAVRAEVAEAAQHKTLDELLQLALDKAELLTGSCIGFFHFVDDDQQNLSLQTWSTNTLKKICTAEGKGRHYPVNQAGVWTDCLRTRLPVIHNDYASLPHKKGLPAGHAPVVRELVVPVVRDGLVMAILGVGNKATDYSSNDVKQVEELAGFVADHALRKRMENELERKEDRLELATRAAQIGIWDWDVVKNELAWDDSMFRLYGIRREDFSGAYQAWIRCVHPDDAKTTEDATQAALRGEKEYAPEFRIVWPDGSVHYIQAAARTIRDKNGKPLRMIGTNIDITERKQLEVEKIKFEIQNQQIQKAESLNRMAAAIAHNFNNQLQAVMMGLELGMIDLPQGLSARANLTEAMKAANNASTLSTMMLTYLGHTFGNRDPLDLSDICRQSLPALQIAKPKEVNLLVALAPSGPVIKADAQQIRQVLTILTTNAWEAYGENAGVIQLAVKTVSTAEIPATQRWPLDWNPKDNAYACLEVSDDAGGIAEEHIKNLFDPFFTTKFTGRGMGLAVVLGIVRAHGGAVTVESAMERGSIFRVFIPLSSQAVPRPPKTPAQVPEIEWSGTMLLVDDNETVRKTVKAVLAQLGFNVLEAGDGIEAVEVFCANQNAIRFVICDLTMPRMDGWETLAALRKLAPGIPVILASGYDQAHVMAGDHPECPQAFLHKPYQQAELRETIRRILADK